LWRPCARVRPGVMEVGRSKKVRCRCARSRSTIPLEKKSRKRVYPWLDESIVAAASLHATGEHENFDSCGFALERRCLCGGRAKTRQHGSSGNQNKSGGNGGA